MTLERVYQDCKCSTDSNAMIATINKNHNSLLIIVGNIIRFDGTRGSIILPHSPFQFL